MFSRISERKMLSVRGLLLLAWLILIVSLFWDPYSILLTEPGNILSPFRVTDHTIIVQNAVLVATPYSLGNRIFWTIAVPILPLFLMVFGHEAWRRICPLSFASQIPGYMGLRRYRSRLERRTGLISRRIPLISPTGWLARHSWYVQFGLLFAGVSIRLLVINSDRQALGIVLLSVIGAAMLTGFLWGGKTWCNYFCPANVVQKIYTEPGGLFESAPHFSRPTLPQSMCRKPSSKGDVSACVACTANCGDIDLQRAYWNGILDPQRRNVYYMFFGLILGFYGYYFIYAGNWDYYFSGIWTHEDGTVQKLLQPGIFVLGKFFVIPKIIAAPLVLLFFCASGLAVGQMIEALYRRFRLRQEGMSEKLIVHHCLSVSAWASINAFYLFGGRPNILLLPPLGGRLIDIAIVALTTVWLRQTLQQNPNRYQQEGMASSLLGELKKLKVNVGQFLEGRKLESLKANEIYLLTKVLPGFSRQQKLDAYRNILDEAVSNGTTASASSLKVLQEFRMQMNITEEEHTKLLEELGLTHISDNDNGMSDDERAESLRHYRAILSSAVASRMDGGIAITDILAEEDFQSTVGVMRQSLQISDAEHEAVIAELFVQSGMVSSKMDEALDTLVRQKSIRLCVEAAVISGPHGQALLDLLYDAMDSYEQAIRIEALSILRNFAPESQFQRYAEDLASLCGRDLDLILRQAVPSKPTLRWRDTLDPAMLAVLLRDPALIDPEQGVAEAGRHTHRKAILGSLDIRNNLLQLLSLDDPLIRALGLIVFGYIDADLAKEAARQMLDDPSDIDHPMLDAVVKYLVSRAYEPDVRENGIILRAVIRMAGQPEQRISLAKEEMTIGSASDNDIVIAHLSTPTYHVVIRAMKGEVRLVRLDEGGVIVDGQALLHESVALKKNSVVTFGTLGNGELEVEIDWRNQENVDSRLAMHPILRLAILARNSRLARLPLATLADLAFQSRVGRYERGAKLEMAPSQECHFLVYQGQVRLFDSLRSDFVSHINFGPGDLIGTDLVGRDSFLFPEVTSDFSILMQVPLTPDVHRLDLSDSPRPTTAPITARRLEEAPSGLQRPILSRPIESRSDQPST